jgi:hypothetical protein
VILDYSSSPRVLCFSKTTRCRKTPERHDELQGKALLYKTILSYLLRIQPLKSPTAHMTYSNGVLTLNTINLFALVQETPLKAPEFFVEV